MGALFFGGQKQEYVADIALDDSDNIYITGNFTSSALLVGGTVVNSSWPENVYVSKFNSLGVFQWLSKSDGLSGYSWTRGTAVHSQGDEYIYFSGITSGQNISFGDIHLSVESANTKGILWKSWTGTAISCRPVS